MDKRQRSIDGLAVREEGPPQPPKTIESEAVKNLRSLGITGEKLAVPPKSTPKPSVKPPTRPRPVSPKAAPSVDKTQPIPIAAPVSRADEAEDKPKHPPEKEKPSTPIFSNKKKSTKPKPSKAQILRYILLVTILGIAVFLAIDTWVVNRQSDIAPEIDDIKAPAYDIPDYPEDNNSEVDTEPEIEVPTSQVQNNPQTSLPANLVGWVSIPKIGINSRIFRVGLDGSGSIMTPSGIHDVGWYNGSAQFGQNGAGFLDGHAGVGNPGVFSRLGELAAGDTITIRDRDGISSWTYVVKSTKTVALSEVDMREALSVYTGFSRGLNIMTCSGTYIRSARTYDKRTIVFSVLE